MNPIVKPPYLSGSISPNSESQAILLNVSVNRHDKIIQGLTTFSGNLAPDANAVHKLKSKVRHAEENTHVTSLNGNTNQGPLFEVNYMMNGNPYNNFTVTRFGINNTVINIPGDFIIEKTSLHFLEFEAIKKGLQHLANNHVVLVDIFPRKDSRIQMTGQNPEIHTIVLFKTERAPNSQIDPILLIDPNDYKFSEHVIDYCNRQADFQNRWSFVKYACESIYGTKKDRAFVSTPYDTLPEEFKAATPRDCIDISAKIALCIKELMTFKNAPAKVETANDVIKSLTNVTTNDAGLGNLFSKTWEKSLQRGTFDARKVIRDKINAKKADWETRLTKYQITVAMVLGSSLKAIEDLAERLPNK